MDITVGSVWTNQTTKHDGARVRVVKLAGERVRVRALTGWSKDRRDNYFFMPLGAFMSQYR